MKCILQINFKSNNTKDNICKSTAIAVIPSNQNPHFSVQSTVLSSNVVDVMATNSEGQQGLSAKASESPATQDAEVYFNSYNDLAVHQLMLKDRPRTLAYRNFFETHRDAVKGKVVLDIGAGTGILSLFAAVGEHPFLI